MMLKIYQQVYMVSTMYTLGMNEYEVAAYAILIVSIGIYLSRLQSSKKSGILELISGEKAQYKVLALLPQEKTRHLKTPSISTVTFYEGKFPIDQLRNRLREIVTANPYLLGKLVRVTPADVKASTPEHNLCEGVTLIYPRECKNICESDYFRVVTDVDIQASTPYEDLVRRVKPFNVPLGKNAIDRDVPLYQVTLFEIEKDKRYCMMVSLCHTIADGFTFYKLYAMLSTASGTTVTALDATRVLRFAEDTKDNLNFGTALHELPFVLWGSLRNRLLHPRMTTRVYYINQQEVEREKKEFLSQSTATAYSTNNTTATAATFISTNDILTAWFYRFTEVALAFMIANFRGRKPYLSEKIAGNYQGRILFANKEMYKPATIRGSLETFKCPTGQTYSLKQIAQLDLALVTNWASFYSDVQFGQDLKIPNHLQESEQASQYGTGEGAGECRQVLHLPVIDVSDVVLRHCLVVFQARSDLTGVILWTRGIPQQRFDREAILRKTAD